MKKMLMMFMVLIAGTAFGQTNPHWVQVDGKPFITPAQYGVHPGPGFGTTDGAVGNLKDAITQAQADGYKGMMLLQGSYSLEDGPAVIDSQFWLRGASDRSFIVSSGDAIQVTSWMGVGIENIRFYSNDTGTAIQSDGGGATSKGIENCSFYRFTTGLSMVNAWQHKIHNVKFNTCDDAILISQPYGTVIDNVEVKECTRGIIATGSNINISNVVCNLVDEYLISVGGEAIRISSIYTESVPVAIKIAVDSGAITIESSNFSLGGAEVASGAVGILVPSGTTLRGLSVRNNIFAAYRPDAIGVSFGGGATQYGELIHNRYTTKETGSFTDFFIPPDGASSVLTNVFQTTTETYLAGSVVKKFQPYDTMSPNVYRNVGVNYDLANKVTDSLSLTVDTEDFRGFIEVFTSGGEKGVFWADGVTEVATPTMSVVSGAPTFEIGGTTADRIIGQINSGEFRVRHTFTDPRYMFVRWYNQQ
jgi:hypothetical protein